MIASVFLKFAVAYLVWGPRFYWVIATLLAFFIYLLKRRFTENRYLAGITYRNLGILSVLFYVSYAAIATWGQYYLWRTEAVAALATKNALAQNLFTSLLAPGYFAQHVWVVYWLSAVLSILCAFLWYLFLRFLKNHNGRYFDEGEVELGLICALAVGWPRFIVFLPFVFVFVLVISLVRLVVFKEQFTTLGGPFLGALLASLLFGDRILELLKLTALRI